MVKIWIKPHHPTSAEFGIAAAATPILLKTAP